MRAAPAQTAAADVVQAAVAALVVGTALGLWCRAWANGSGGPVGAVLADLGAPWVLAAFAAGAAVAGSHRAAALERSSGLLAGGIAGGGALAVASLVYYDGSTGRHAVLWMALGLVVGGLAGGAGASWAVWRRAAPGATAAAALGLVLAAEAVARFAGTLGTERSVAADLIVLSLAGLGVLAPLVLTRRSVLGVAGSVGVLALAVPTAALLALAPALLAIPTGL
jgi:hypothetical protein